jgi:hypothetical protein
MLETLLHLLQVDGGGPSTDWIVAYQIEMDDTTWSNMILMLGIPYGMVGSVPKLFDGVSTAAE